jgi:hypothetical protein
MLDANTDLKKLAEWIAEQMGWQAVNDEENYSRWRNAITHTENGVTLKLWLSIEGGRLRISADALGLYEFTWMNERFPVISCSLTKTPPQMARDIERRVLPEYRALVVKLLERKALHDERERKQHACCQDIADILNAEMREGQGRHSEPYVHCYGTGSSSIEFTVQSDTSVKIEIRGASFEAAKQIAHTTQEWLRYGWNKENEHAKIAEEEEQMT